MDLKIEKKSYIETKPFPYVSINNFLDTDFALEIQKEILDIEEEKWDRYENPFEKKYTLRDKNNLPKNCKKLFQSLISKNFIKQISNLVETELYIDETKNWNGVHKYKNGDYLDIHCDAGLHPTNNLKKHVTLGIYLSKDWKEENGGHLEIWEGESISKKHCKLKDCVDKILPEFNKLVLFNCTDSSWHGNPEPVRIEKNETRIFLTISYLSKIYYNEYSNKLKKAFFIPRPNDVWNEEKINLRSKPETCKDIYKI